MIENEGPIHVSNVAIVDPKDHKPTRVGIRRDRTVAACASRSAREGSSTDMATTQGPLQRRDPRRRWCASSATTPMQAPKMVKVTLNMGVGEAKQDSKMLEAAQ